MKKKRIIIVIAAAVLVLAAAIGICVCFFSSRKSYKPPETLNDLAYTVEERNGYTVYIEEEAGYQPYLVLTNDYNDDGNVLLLRKYVLDEWQPYHTYGQRSAYYENSNLDEYLSNVFLNTLSEELRAKIIQSYIQIIALDAYHGYKAKIETIQIERKAFLLSYTEMAPRGSPDGYIHEGKPLKFFYDYPDRMGTTKEDREESGWWLRTPSMGYPTMGTGVNDEGMLGFSPVSLYGGVRPSFCLPRDIQIGESNEIIPGETVYVLK